MLTYATLALFVMCFAKFNLVQTIVFTSFSTGLTNHSSGKTSSVTYSSTASSASASTIAASSSALGSTGPVDVLMIPSGTGVIVFPLTIVLSLGPPKPFLFQRCDA